MFRAKGISQSISAACCPFGAVIQFLRRDLIGSDLCLQVPLSRLQVLKCLVFLITGKFHLKPHYRLLSGIPHPAGLFLLMPQMCPLSLRPAPACLCGFQLLTQKILIQAGQIVFMAAVDTKIIIHLRLAIQDDLQLLDTPPHILQHLLQGLKAVDVLPQGFDIDLLLIQNIGIDEILDVMDGPEGQGFGDQRQEFMIQTAEAVEDHFSGFRCCLHKLAEPPVRRTEHGYTFDLTALKEKIIIKQLVLHQVPGNIRLFLLRRRIHHGTNDEVLLLLLIEKLKGDVRRQAPFPFIGPLFPSRLTADVTVQSTLAFLMGCFIEVGLGAGHNELDGIQHRGFAGSILAGEQDGSGEFQRLVLKAVPVDQTHSCQDLHDLRRLPSCSAAKAGLPAGYPPYGQPSGSNRRSGSGHPPAGYCCPAVLPG